jgi:hypothetical protein
MAAVLEPKEAVAQAADRAGSRVDEQLAQATSRIRTYDVTFGATVLVVLALGYAAVAISLDKYLNLAEWVRQLMLAGFGAAFAVTAYFCVVRPAMRRINPLYAAARVEQTLDDAKNSVTGYVDAQQRGNLNPTVRAALASRAAQAASEADVNRAVDTRGLLYAGVTAAVLLVALTVLFFVFRPAQFKSLVGRTFVPFSSDPIKSRTDITIVKPEPADATFTAGQPVVIAVKIGGKVPSADAADKPRLLIRHNPNDPNYDEVPLVPGANSREFELRVPDYLVQNGFWYKVAAGDAETPEYRVTVRALPGFTTFAVKADFPKYLRRDPETTDDPNVKAPRGTQITFTARTNRKVRDGSLKLETGALVQGVPDATDDTALVFKFKVTESAKYRLSFSASDGERSPDNFQSTITMIPDLAPQVIVNNPEPEEIQLPANGLLAVDGKIGDDHGIDTVTLKLRVIAPLERALADVPYLNGTEKSFKRAKDETFPTDLEYKGSVDLGAIKKDAAGVDLVLTPDTVIEYWLEATDNCTEPKPNVGRSTAKRVKILPPKMDPAEQEDLNQRKDQRKDQEQKHNKDQKQNLDNEQRDRQPPAKKQGGEQPKKEDKPGAGDGAPKQDTKPGTPKDNGDKGGMTDKGPGMPMGAPMPKDKDDAQPKPPNDGMGMGMGMNQPGGGMGMPEAPPPKTPEERNLNNNAQDLKKEIDKENQSGGSPKPNNAANEAERTEPGAPKPQPKDGMMNGMGGANPSEPKPQPKQPDPMGMGMPMGGGSAPGEQKPAGDVQKPDDPAQPKPDAGNKPAAPSETRREPGGAPPGLDKQQPKEPQPMPKGGEGAKTDPGSGSGAKPAKPEPKDGDPKQPDAKGDPAADAGSRAKPIQEPNRGGDKPNQPPQPQPKNGDEGAGGDVKPQKPPAAGGAKPAPKEGDPNAQPKEPEAKPNAGANGAGDTKPDTDPKNPPPGAAGKPVDKGTDKSEPKQDRGAGNGADAGGKKRELTPEQKKDLEDAARDLNSPDPAKQQAARDKIDKMVGKETREAAEKLAKDLQSPDEATRKAAEKKLEELKKAAADKRAKDNDAKGGKGDPKKQSEIADALDDLTSGDPARQNAGAEKLKKVADEKARKDAEQMLKDLKSEDKATRDAAEQKLRDMKDQLAKKDGKDTDGAPKGKQPTPEEIAELAKKAQQLQSADEKERKQAQKELDDKIGEENRKKLEEMLKNQKPGEPEAAKKLQDQLDKLAGEGKLPRENWKPGGGDSTPPKGPADEDPKNRLKTAELNLEEFEKNRYNKALQDKKGWSQAEYDRFLKEYDDYVKRLRSEVARDADKTFVPPSDPSAPRFRPGDAGKVEGGTGPGGPAGVGGPAAAPPGFEGAREKFLKGLPKKP